MMTTEHRQVARVRGVDVDIVATHREDEIGQWTKIEIATLDEGVPLDSAWCAGQISGADLWDLADAYRLGVLVGWAHWDRYDSEQVAA